LAIAIAVLLGTTSAGSYYANDDPESCDLIGGVSMYGLGIRLGYYLQWFAAIISVYMAPDLVKTIYVTFAGISIASFACVFQNIRSGYFAALEFHIIILLTAFLSSSAFRWSPVAREVEEIQITKRTFITGGQGGKVKRSFWAAWSFLNLSTGLAYIAVPYMYWHGNYVGHKEGCQVQIIVTIIFYTWHVDIFDSKWIIAIKVLGMIAALIGAALIFFSSKLLYYLAAIRFTGGERDYSDTCDKVTYTFMQLLTGGFIIGMVEATVAINHVDLSKATLDSSGQLIPLLIGAMTLLLVILSYLRRLAGQFSVLPAMVKYTENVSRISDRIEKFIAKRVNVGSRKGCTRKPRAKTRMRTSTGPSQGHCPYSVIRRPDLEMRIDRITSRPLSLTTLKVISLNGEVMCEGQPVPLGRTMIQWSMRMIQASCPT
jgi:hypothetical protein